jgi:hypothetical protein
MVTLDILASKVQRDSEDSEDTADATTSSRILVSYLNYYYFLALKITANSKYMLKY